jgi:hypothetical protein
MRNVATFSILFALMAGLAFAADQDPAIEPSPEQIRAWRAEGPPAVDRLMAKRLELIAAAENVPGKKTYTLADQYVVQSDEERGAWKRVQAISKTIDAVAGAKYSHESGLFWYTDEAEAMRVAKAERKPILALRLLGNLDEEFSCANSRYFRFLLYPDESVRKLLRERFVLTWKSVRPVPKITIDFGDGRKVERTITGNSVHYVLLPSGQVVDVFPGLYGPKPFFSRLSSALTAAQRALDAEEATPVLTAYRQEQLAELRRAWQADCEKYAELPTHPAKQVPSEVGYAPSAPRDFWSTIADFHPEYAELGQASRELMEHEAVVGYYAPIDSPEHRVARKHGDRVIPVLAWVKGGDEAILGTLLNCVTPSLQADTLYNEYCGRFIALELLADSPRESAEELNQWIYRHVFGYDPDDPWAGLSRLESLTALPNRGLIRPSESQRVNRR